MHIRRKASWLTPAKGWFESKVLTHEQWTYLKAPIVACTQKYVLGHGVLLTLVWNPHHLQGQLFTWGPNTFRNVCAYVAYGMSWLKAWQVREYFEKKSQTHIHRTVLVDRAGIFTTDPISVVLHAQQVGAAVIPMLRTAATPQLVAVNSETCHVGKQKPFWKENVVTMARQARQNPIQLKSLIWSTYWFLRFLDLRSSLGTFLPSATSLGRLLVLGCFSDWSFFLVQYFLAFLVWSLHEELCWQDLSATSWAQSWLSTQLPLLGYTWAPQGLIGWEPQAWKGGKLDGWTAGYTYLENLTQRLRLSSGPLPSSKT